MVLVSWRLARSTVFRSRVALNVRSCVASDPAAASKPRSSKRSTRIRNLPTAPLTIASFLTPSRCRRASFRSTVTSFLPIAHFAMRSTSMRRHTGSIFQPPVILEESETQLSSRGRRVVQLLRTRKGKRWIAWDVCEVKNDHGETEFESVGRDVAVERECE